MNNPRNISVPKIAFFVILSLAAIILALLAPKAAVNIDEHLHHNHARDVVNWYFTMGQDTSCLHTPETNLKYYGQSADNFTALVIRVFRVENEFLVRHYTGALFFLLLLLFSGMLAFRLSGSWLMATFVILALAFMPRLAGHAFGNLKDIPFATGYMAGLLMIFSFLKEMPLPRWRTSILMGLAIAFTFSVRAGGLILFFYFGIALIVFFLIRPFYLRQLFSTRPLLFQFAGRLAIVALTGYFAGLLFWPFALQNVFLNPVESLGVMEHYMISIRQLFEGRVTWSTLLPWYYLPKWLFISTPPFVLAGLVLFLVFFTRDMIRLKNISRQLLTEGFILFAILFPALYVMIIGANLYSGVRQMLFILPPMTLLATAGVFKFLELTAKTRKIFVFFASLFFIPLLVWPLRHQIETFPADYVYFNALAGGNKKAWGNYEYDYYFHGIKEAAAYLVDLKGDEKITVAMNCNLVNYFTGHHGISVQYTRFPERSSVDWDYGLFGLNYLHPHLLKNNVWQPSGIIKTFYHKGNPVAVLVKRVDKSDFMGIMEIKNGNLNKGKELIEQALANNPNNIWLYANLAKAKIDSENMVEFEYYIRKGREIHPFYEPFYLLEASTLFDKGNYDESLRKLGELSEINPYYQPANELYKKITEIIPDK
jgi:tetratricopeptide (TPR) repeat protein